MKISLLKHPDDFTQLDNTILNSIMNINPIGSMKSQLSSIYIDIYKKSYALSNNAILQSMK